MDPYQVLPLQVRVDLETMAMKEYSSTFSKVPALLEPHHQTVGIGVSYTSAEMSRYIFQSQPTGLEEIGW